MQALRISTLLGIGLATSHPAIAQGLDGRFSLGIEVPVAGIRHTSQDVSVPGGTNGQSSNVSVGRTSTTMGLFATGAGVNAQYGLGTQAVLGARLSLQRETSTVDGSSTTERSQLSLLPRFEFYVSPDESVRPHFGLEAGDERSTSNGPSGVTSNLWLLGTTGGISYFPSSNWSIDVNASLYLLTGTEDVLGQSASSSGYGGLLRISLSSWFGSTPSNGIVAPPVSTSPVSTSAAMAAPEDTRVVSGYRGAVQRELSIAPGLVLALTTYPIVTSDVRYTLTMEGDATAFAGCESLGIEFAGHTIRATQLQRRTRPGGFTAEDTVAGTFPIDVFDAATLAEGDSALVFCQRRWPLTTNHLDRIKGLKVATDMIANGQGLVAGDTTAVEMLEQSVKTELVLSPDVSLRLESNPLLSAHTVAASLAVRGQSDMSSSCRDLGIHIDGTAPLQEGVRASRVATSAGVTQVLEGQLSFVVLAQIAAGTGEEVVDACGFKASISPANREQTWAFIASSVGLAKRLGAWHGFRVPTPDSKQGETNPGVTESQKRKRK